MDQRAIVLYLARKGSTVIEIHGDLRAPLGLYMIRYSNRTYYLGEDRCKSFNQPSTINEKTAEINNCDWAILLVLDEQPFPFIQQFARLTHPSGTVVQQKLVYSFGFQIWHSRWVPYF